MNIVNIFMFDSYFFNAKKYHFLKKSKELVTKKKVSFSNDTKKYDGSSNLNSNFGKLCMMYFTPNCKYGTIESPFNIINFIYDNNLTDSFIEYCLNELKIARQKITYIKIHDAFIYNEIEENIRYEGYHYGYNYWNNDFWVIRSNSFKNNIGKFVQLNRTGSRDFSICIGVIHLNILDKLIELLNDTMEWYK